MRIILFRHGPARDRDPERWPDDGERPLTARGQARTLRAARGLARLEDGIGHVLTSPLKRARQTATLLEQALGAEVEILEALAPEGSPRAVLARLGEADADGKVVLVGHEPALGKLAGLLAFPSAGLSLPLKKAGACAVDFEGAPRAGAGSLRWLLTPSALRRLAARGRKP